MNVAGAWALGYTGKGVVVTILDDGIQLNHPDLIANYVSLLKHGIEQRLTLQLLSLFRTLVPVMILMTTTPIQLHKTMETTSKFRQLFT